MQDAMMLGFVVPVPRASWLSEPEPFNSANNSSREKALTIEVDSIIVNISFRIVEYKIGDRSRQNRMRVGIIALQHESNTFLPQATSLEDFRRNVLLTGEAVREHFRNSHHEVGGFFNGLWSAGMEAVPLFAAIATPGGVVTDDAFGHLLTEMLDCLDGAGPLAGILAAPMGPE